MTRQRFLAGCNALVRPTLRQYLVLQGSCFASLAVGAAGGYVVAPGPAFDDSTGTGIGLVVGLALWTIGVGRLIWVGGPTHWRDLGWRRR